MIVATFGTSYFRSSSSSSSSSSISRRNRLLLQRKITRKIPSSLFCKRGLFSNSRTFLASFCCGGGPSLQRRPYSSVLSSSSSTIGILWFFTAITAATSTSSRSSSFFCFLTKVSAFPSSNTLSFFPRSHCTTSRAFSSTTTFNLNSATKMSSTTDNNEFMFKRVKVNNDNNEKSEKIIGTHSGTFQADEAMGVFLLRQTPTFRNAKVVRTRDAAIYETLDIVIDVGGVYNHETLRYDHHQRGYNERFMNESDRCTKLSASGLVYRHYGKQVIQAFYPNLASDYVDIAYIKLYDKLLQALDAVDTGEEMAPQHVQLRYKDTTTLSSRVARLNPRWNEIGDDGTDIDVDERFEMAVNLCGQDFCSVLEALVESELPARSLVEKALLARHTTHASGEILLFESGGGLPWKSHLYELEVQHGITNDKPLIKFILYQDSANMWRVQAVTVEGTLFENRLSLPESWCGLRDVELVQVSGINGARFVHAAGFIGGADTYEAVLQMAQKTLELQQA